MATAVLRRAAAAAATPPRAASSMYHVSRFIRNAAPPCAASSIGVARIASSIGVVRFAGLSGSTAASSSDGAVISRAAASSSSDGALIPRAAASSSSDGALIPRAAASSTDARLTRSVASSTDARLTRAAASSRAPAGLLTTAPARFGVATRTLTAPTTGMLRCIHSVPPRRTIHPHVLLALQRLDDREFHRYKNIDDTIEKLRATLIADESDTVLFLTEQVIHVGSISWRVCTTVLAVAVGAGLLHVAKSGWEEHFHKSTCSHITARIAHSKADLEEYIVKTIAHRTSVAAANAFLESEKAKERTVKLEEREAILAAKEVDFLVAEESLHVKEVVSGR